MRQSFLKFAVATVLLITALSCSTTKNAGSEKHYQLSGVVLGLNAKDQTANIKHGPIAGWMEAMTMDYPIRSKQDFDQLHIGERVTATVVVSGTDYELTDVRKQSTTQ